MRKKVLLCWSSGKDSAWTLHVLRQRSEVEVVGLVTTVSKSSQRVVMHDVRVKVLECQAKSTGLPLQIVSIPDPCSIEAYEAVMHEVLYNATQEGVEQMAFGDLFLEDIKAYREARLKDTGISAIFPLWGSHTSELAREMIAGGLRAVVTCVDSKQLDSNLVGHAYDRKFLAKLPDVVDPCGENGEFHTLVIDGPMFANPISISAGSILERNGFVYADFSLTH